jgi:hypothetical protein
VCGTVVVIPTQTFSAPVTLLFGICEFFNVEKCKDIKYFLTLIFQNILGTFAVKKSVHIFEELFKYRLNI